jgi:hypothetical protein
MSRPVSAASSGAWRRRTSLQRSVDQCNKVAEAQPVPICQMFDGGLRQGCLVRIVQFANMKGLPTDSHEMHAGVSTKGDPERRRTSPIFSDFFCTEKKFTQRRNQILNCGSVDRPRFRLALQFQFRLDPVSACGPLVSGALQFAIMVLRFGSLLQYPQ